jgi:hypothetical protein
VFVRDASAHGASRSRWGWWSRFQRLKAASLVSVKRNGSVGDSTWPSQKTTLASLSGHCLTWNESVDKYSSKSCFLDEMKCLALK